MSTPSVLPFELWDVEIDGHPLQDWRKDPSFPTRLATLVRELVTGSHPLGPTLPPCLREITSIVLAGGGAHTTHADALRTKGLDARLLTDPVFGPTLAGFVHGPRPVDLCADVGQTSIKLHDGRRSWRVDRDATRAPTRAAVLEHPDRDAWGLARARTLRFVAEALRTPGAPRRIRLALPCQIIEGCPTVCTYCWDDPDRRFRTELSALLDIAPADLHLLNDAELAAWAARHEPGPTRHQPVLVLTIGFGVGAAVLEPVP